MITKRYQSLGAYERDAKKLFKKGYHVTSVVHQPGHTLWGHSVVKWVTLVGILTGPSKTKDQISVVYTHVSAVPHAAPSFAST